MLTACAEPLLMATPVAMLFVLSKARTEAVVRELGVL